MADISIPAVKTYVLKVNLQCCEACPKKLEKVLMNTSGVYSFKINTKKGLVKVASIVDLDILKQSIKKKVGKIVEIYNPKRDNKNRGKHQSRVDSSDDDDDDHTHHGVHNMRPMPRGASSSTSKHHPQIGMGRKGSVEIDPRIFGNVPMPQPAIARPPYYGEVPYRSGHCGPGNVPMPQPAIARPPYYGGNVPLPQPAIARPPYYGEVPYTSGHYGPVGVYNKPPPTAPPLPPHGYYGGRLPGPYVHSLNDPLEPPKGNSMFHAISDDNVRAPACTIM